MDTDTARLRKVLGGSDIEWLLTRLRERMAAGLPLTGPVRLRNPTQAQRSAVDGLLGRRSGTSDTISVPLDKLDAVLRDAGIHSTGLESAVFELTGPVLNRADAVAADIRAWSAALAPGADLAARVPELSAWWERMSGRGVIRRLARDPETAAKLVADAVAVLTELPVRRELLAVFASRVLSGAHALDPDRPVATVVVSALRAMAELPDEADRRTAWSSAGIIVDEISTTVLTLGLTATGDTAPDQAVNLWHATGQPVVFTLRQLGTGAPRFHGATDIYVCENPAVVAAAADRFGATCPPLICTAGQPSAAVIRLLDLLTDAGASLRYHGDFDWYGIAIANFLRRRYTWHPWRFTAIDYTATTLPSEKAPLRGNCVDATWDGELAAAMVGRGVQIEEELVIDQLLTDLAPTTSGSASR
ncbi:TIGR02679 family protein [Nocardia sp. IBHARD005]|uniref:TIGR02679 family protein n=1 Tax=Nocardia sp. IBHARD005 TaxID=3457765 RepID=UPI0040584F10